MLSLGGQSMCRESILAAEHGVRNSMKGIRQARLQTIGHALHFFCIGKGIIKAFLPQAPSIEYATNNFRKPFDHEAISDTLLPYDCLKAMHAIFIRRHNPEDIKYHTRSNSAMRHEEDQTIKMLMCQVKKGQP